MNTETYFTTIQFIKDRVASNLVTAVANDKIKLERVELERVLSLVKSSIEQAAIDASGNFET